MKAWASASARASNSAQVRTRSPWILAGRSGCDAAMASQTSARVHTAIISQVFFRWDELGALPRGQVNCSEAEHQLGHDVPLHLVGPAVDGGRAVIEVAGHGGEMLRRAHRLDVAAGLA